MATQSPVMIDVDTSDLRVSSKKQLRAKLQKKFESWSPRLSTNTSFAEKIDGAARRRLSFVETKVSKVAKINTKASTVAEQQRAARSAALAQAATLVADKEASAEKKRKAAQLKIVSANQEHVKHVKDVSEQHKAKKQQLALDKQLEIELSQAGAEARRTSLLQEQQLKAAAEVAKAKSLAEKKKAQLDAKKKQLEAKRAAAEARKFEMAQTLLDKLRAQEDHAQQVRKNKGSTPSRTTANAENKTLKIFPEPVSFDMDVRSPTGDSPTKPPVQLRLEERAGQDKAGGSDIKGAERRRLSFVDERTAAAAKSNKHATDVASEQRQAKAQALEKLKTAVQSKIAAADQRRQAALKDSAQQNKRTVNSPSKDLPLKDKKQRLDEELAAAEARRATIEAARVQKAKAFAAPYTPERKTVASC